MISLKILCILIFFGCFYDLVRCRTFNNGLIFYNLETQNSYLPPTISVSRGRGLAMVKYSLRGSIWSTFGKPCHCEVPLCSCCVGIKVKQYNFDQKMCANVSYARHKDEIQLEVSFNNTPTAKYGIAARNPSPLCVPVMMGIPMSMCIQMSNIGVQGDNLNMCMDFLVRLASTELFEMHFQCMKVGLQGASWVGPDGQPVIPANEGKIRDKSANDSDEYYDENVDEEVSEIVLNEEDGKNAFGGTQKDEQNSTEEEMDCNDITEKTTDVTKEKNQLDTKNNKSQTATPFIGNNNEQILTNIKYSIIAEENDLRMKIPMVEEVNKNQLEHNQFASSDVANYEGNVKESITEKLERNKESSVLQTLNDNTNNKNYEGYENIKNISEVYVKNTVATKDIEENNEIFESIHNSESLTSNSLKSDLYEENVSKSSLENELQLESNKKNIKDTISEAEKELKEYNKSHVTEEEITPEHISDNNETMDSSTQKVVTVTLQSTMPQDIAISNKISSTYTKENATSAARMNATSKTTTSKPTRSDKISDELIANIKNIDHANNIANSGEGSDCSNESDSDYEEEEHESNNCTTFGIKNKNCNTEEGSSSTLELVNESSSNESDLNDDTEESTSDEFQTVEIEVDINGDMNDHHKNSDEELLTLSKSTKGSMRIITQLLPSLLKVENN